MLTTALATAAMHGGFGHPGGPWFLLIPLFWILVIGVIVAVFGRSRFRNWHGGTGGARQVLAQRYANGDIDEQEYRARLEVLQATETR